MITIFNAVLSVMQTDIFLSFAGILVAFAVIMLVLNAFSVGSPTKRL